MPVPFIQYQALTGPVVVSAAAAADPTQQSWTKNYPDLHRYLRSFAGGLVVAPLYVPDVTSPAPACSWKGTQPDSARPLVSLARFTHPFSHAFREVTSNPGGRSIAVGSIPFIQYQSLTGPVFVPTAEVYDAALFPWNAPYPDRFFSKPGLHASQHPAWSCDWVANLPTLPLPPAFDPEEATFFPHYPDRFPAPYRRATYIAAQSMFGYEVDVPVMSWTGMYLDPPVRRKRFTIFPTIAMPLPNVVAPTVTALSWKGFQPDRLPRKPALHPSRQSAFGWARVTPFYTFYAFGSNIIINRRRTT